MADNPINKSLGLKSYDSAEWRDQHTIHGKVLGDFYDGDASRQDKISELSGINVNASHKIAKRINGEDSVADKSNYIILVPDISNALIRSKTGKLNEKGNASRTKKPGGFERITGGRWGNRALYDQFESAYSRDSFYVVVGVIDETAQHVSVNGYGSVAYGDLFRYLIGSGYDPLLPFRDGNGSKKDLCREFEKRLGVAYVSAINKANHSYKTIRAAMNPIAREVRNRIRDYIGGGSKPPLEPKTMSNRRHNQNAYGTQYKNGIDMPLSESGQLERAIEFKIISYRSLGSKNRYKERKHARQLEDERRESAKRGRGRPRKVWTAKEINEARAAEKKRMWAWQLTLQGWAKKREEKARRQAERKRQAEVNKANRIERKHINEVLRKDRTDFLSPMLALRKKHIEAVRRAEVEKRQAERWYAMATEDEQKGWLDNIIKWKALPHYKKWVMRNLGLSRPKDLRRLEILFPGKKLTWRDIPIRSKNHMVWAWERSEEGQKELVRLGVIKEKKEPKAPKIASGKDALKKIVKKREDGELQAPTLPSKEEAELAEFLKFSNSTFGKLWTRIYINKVAPSLDPTYDEDFEGDVPFEPIEKFLGRIAPDKLMKVGKSAFDFFKSGDGDVPEYLADLRGMYMDKSVRGGDVESYEKSLRSYNVKVEKDEAARKAIEEARAKTIEDAMIASRENRIEQAQLDFMKKAIEQTGIQFSTYSGAKRYMDSLKKIGDTIDDELTKGE